MPSFFDDEFGEVTIRRNARTSSINASIAPNGSVRITLPSFAPLFLAKRLLQSSRQQIQRMKEQLGGLVLIDGMQIGKSHSILVVASTKPGAVIRGQQIVVSLPEGMELTNPLIYGDVHEMVLKALRKEAKSYLPRRLAHIAERNNFNYSSVRFSHASTRWGSCSSNGTISLNIALMMQPFEVIDYVIIHELSHLRHMNHSDSFWVLVATMDPDYKVHRKILKSATPHI